MTGKIIMASIEESKSASAQRESGGRFFSKSITNVSLMKTDIINKKNMPFSALLVNPNFVCLFFIRELLENVLCKLFFEDTFPSFIFYLKKFLNQLLKGDLIACSLNHYR